MKKAIICIAAALSVATMLSSCASHKCNVCNKSCSARHSYKDGQVVICNSCYKKCFNSVTKVDPEIFFAEEK